MVIIFDGPGCLQLVERQGAMTPVPSWEFLLEQVRRRTAAAIDASMLVSIAFVHPSSLIFRDLQLNYSYLDLRSGSAWDLYFAGYVWGGWTPGPSSRGIWDFDPRLFHLLATRIADEHVSALEKVDSSVALAAWEFSGTADLVSFMAYRDFPGHIDWPSLRAVQVLNSKGDYRLFSLGEIVERMSDWRYDKLDLQYFMSDTGSGESMSVLSLSAALKALAAAVAGGLVGNAAYELLKSIAKGP